MLGKNSSHPNHSKYAVRCGQPCRNLRFAAKQNCVDCIKAIVTKDKDSLNEKGGWRGATALHWACYYGSLQAAEALLDLGADMNCRNRKNRETPRDNAVEANQTAIIILLDSYHRKRQPRQDPLLKQLSEQKEEEIQREEILKKLSLNVAKLAKGEVQSITTEYVELITKNFDKTRIIARGGFGIIYLAIDEAVGKRYALKKMVNDGDIKNFEREIEAVARFDHPNIIKLIGYEGKKHCCILYELGEKGSVYDNLVDDEKARIFAPFFRFSCLLNIGSALNYLHSQNVCHRDVTTKNIVLMQDFTSELIDCGLVVFMSADVSSSQSSSSSSSSSFTVTRVLGTPGYLCSKYCNTGKYSSYSEMYSFGVCIVECLSGSVVEGGVDLVSKYLSEEDDDDDYDHDDDNNYGDDNDDDDDDDDELEGIVNNKKSIPPKNFRLADLRCKWDEYRCLDQGWDLAKALTTNDNIKKRPSAKVCCQIFKQILVSSSSSSALSSLSKSSPVSASSSSLTLQCVICLEESAGTITCDINNSHYLCKSCINFAVDNLLHQAHARSLHSKVSQNIIASYVYKMNKEERVLPCFYHSFCVGRYKNDDLAKNLNETLFADFLKLRDSVLESYIKKKLTDSNNNSNSSSSSSGNKSVYELEEYIINEILSLACPRCKTVFFDFDGCASLQCYNCQLLFCGVCLQAPADSSRDGVHAHVANCGQPRAGDPIFIPYQVWLDLQRKRKLKLFQEFVNGLQDGDVKEALTKKFENRI